MVQQLVSQSTPQAQLIFIDRIQNVVVAKVCCSRMERKNKGVVTEKWLFHGTMDTQPSKIYTSEQSFDFHYSSYCLWGMGTYFAEKASYSHKYTHHFFDHIKQLLLARVLTGETYTCLPCSTLKKPPNKIPASDDKGDGAVRGEIDDSNIIIHCVQLRPVY